MDNDSIMDDIPVRDPGGGGRAEGGQPHQGRCKKLISLWGLESDAMANIIKKIHFFCEKESQIEIQDSYNNCGLIIKYIWRSMKLEKFNILLDVHKYGTTGTGQSQGYNLVQSQMNRG